MKLCEWKGFGINCFNFSPAEHKLEKKNNQQWVVSITVRLGEGRTCSKLFLVVHKLLKQFLFQGNWAFDSFMESTSPRFCLSISMPCAAFKGPFISCDFLNLSLHKQTVWNRKLKKPFAAMPMSCTSFPQLLLQPIGGGNERVGWIKGERWGRIVEEDSKRC